MKRVQIIETNLTFTGPLLPRQITDGFVLHHFGKLPSGFDINKIDARWTHEMHIKERGWLGIAYHYLVKHNGIIERGRPNWSIGSHCKGFNRSKIGICIAADCSENTPPSATIENLLGLYADLHDKYGLVVSDDTIKGHRDYVPTTQCPGDALYAMLPDIRQRVRGLLGH